MQSLEQVTTDEKVDESYSRGAAGDGQEERQRHVQRHQRQRDEPLGPERRHVPQRRRRRLQHDAVSSRGRTREFESSSIWPLRTTRGTNYTK